MLSRDDLALLESTLLPALERHYLRLLAHGLRTFQAIAANAAASDGSTVDGLQPLPDPAQWKVWAAAQGAMADDPAFQAAFLEQLSRLQQPLETIAGSLSLSPLDLQIGDLVQWATGLADDRINRSAAQSVTEAAGPPPG
jgi:hypothetical protein